MPLIPRCGDHHRIHIRLAKGYIAFEQLPFMEIPEDALDPPAALSGSKAHMKPLIPVFCYTLGRVLRKIQFAHRERVQHGFRMFP